MKKAAMIVCAICILAGCNSGPIRSCPRPEPKSEVRTATKTFRTYGLDEQERWAFQYAMSKMGCDVPTKVKAAIMLSQDEYMAHYEDRSSGHAHTSAGDICALRDWDETWTILVWWHEAAHVWRWHLPTSADDEWRKIAGRVYVNTYDYDITKANDYPKDGVLRLHGSANYSEDMAIYIEAAYAYHYLSVNQFAGADWSDPRYLQKIKFLYKRGGLSKEVFEAISAIPAGIKRNAEDPK